MPNLIFPNDIPSKANPIDADLLLIADTEDNSELKKVTIGSLTTDIGDGLIVDGSESLTTTYSSTKINDLNDAQDTTISSNYSTLNTNKLNRNAQLRTGNGAWKTTYNDGSGNEVELALGASGTVLNSNGASAAPTWVTPSVSITGQTEDTTGDMDADFALVYDNSAGANRKQKINVYRATNAEVNTGTATNKFITPAQANWRATASTNYKINHSAEKIETAPGVQTVMKSIVIPFGGSVKVSFEVHNYDPTNVTYTLYNGTSVGTSTGLGITTSSTTYVTVTGDINVCAGETLEVRVNTTSNICYCRNFQIGYDLTSFPIPVTII